MSSTIGENSLPPILMSMKEAAASSDPHHHQQQQLQLPRQVLGNVGNSGVNLVSQQQQKKEHFLSQVGHAKTCEQSAPIDTHSPTGTTQTNGAK